MNHSVCFTGHRNIDKHEQGLEKALTAVVEQLITQNGVTDFYAGGAYGFDAFASLIVLQMKQAYSQVKLHLILPCSNDVQTAKWSEEQKNEFEFILGHSDSVEYISDRYYNGCMEDRNARLVELATVCCICYWNPKNFRSGTGQTVRMAQKKGLKVINLFEDTENSLSDGLTERGKRSIIKVSYESEVTKMPRAKKTETTPAQTEAVTEIVKVTSAPVAEKPAKAERKRLRLLLWKSRLML